METTIMIFISKKELRAFDVEQSRAISCNGNLFFEYATEDDIYKFDEFIKDEYNLELYSDIPIDFFVINLNAEKRFVNILNDKINDANCVNIINDKYIIPIVFAMKQKIEKSSKNHINIFDSNYIVKCNNDGAINIEYITECKDDFITLKPKDFFNYINLHTNKFGIDEELIEKKDKEIEKTKQELKTQIKENNEMQKAKESLETKLNNQLKINKEVNQLKDKVKEQNIKLENYVEYKVKELEELMVIYELDNKPSNFMKYDDSLVCKDDKLFNKEYDQPYLKSPIKGRLFYFCFDTINSYGVLSIKNQKYYLALIVPKSWTKETALKQYFSLQLYKNINKINKNENIIEILDSIAERLIDRYVRNSINTRDKLHVTFKLDCDKEDSTSLVSIQSFF